MVKLLIGVYYRIVNVKLLYVFNIYYFFVGLWNIKLKEFKINRCMDNKS